MKKYNISEFEQYKIDEILTQLRREKEFSKLDELDEAYYIYHELGKAYKGNTEFVLTNIDTEYEEKKEMYGKKTGGDGKAICANMSTAFAEALLQNGIEAEIIKEDGELPHVDTIFRTSDGKKYFANLIRDIHRIQTGMRVRSFGKASRILEIIMKKQNRMDYFRKLTEKYGDLEEVTKEKIEELDRKFNFCSKGMYTEDVFKMIMDEVEDQKQIEIFFGTSDPEQLVEKKINFAMNIIGIANKHGKEKIGYGEGIKYYLQLQKNMLTDEERKKYIHFIQGYRIEDGRKMPEAIIILLRDIGNKYYRYDEEEKKFLEVEDIEEIKQLDIQYNGEEKNTLKRETKQLNILIENLEKRFDREENEHEK